jgi:hypothetical protein
MGSTLRTHLPPLYLGIGVSLCNPSASRPAPYSIRRVPGANEVPQVGFTMHARRCIERAGIQRFGNPERFEKLSRNRPGAVLESGVQRVPLVGVFPSWRRPASVNIGRSRIPHRCRPRFRRCLARVRRVKPRAPHSVSSRKKCCRDSLWVCGGAAVSVMKTAAEPYVLATWKRSLGRGVIRTAKGRRPDGRGTATTRLRALAVGSLVLGRCTRNRGAEACVVLVHVSGVAIEADDVALLSN